MKGGAFITRVSDGPAVEDNLFVPNKQNQDTSASFSQSVEIFQELQQECMRRLNVPTKPQMVQSAEEQQSSFSTSEDKPQIPPRVPIPPRPVKRGDYASARWSKDLSVSPLPAETKNSLSVLNGPPQIPPRDPLSQPGSRTPSPICPLGSTSQRPFSVSPSSLYSSYLSTSPGKAMPTTHSFASDPKYTAPKVIQAQEKNSSSKGPCILPIVRDGQKVSNTHYYLLPERPSYLDRLQRFFREAESLPTTDAEERPVRPPNMATVRPMVVNPQTGQGHVLGLGLIQSGELKTNLSSNNNMSLSGPCPEMKTSVSLPRVSSDGVSAAEVSTSCTMTDTGGHSVDRVKMVR